MADFKKLVQEMKSRDLKLMMGLVMNYTSDEHPWFTEAKKSKDNPFRNFFIWKAPKDGKEPNDWVSFFAGKAWTLDEKTGEYYLHYFTKKQPTTNWHNEAVRKGMFRFAKFWLDKGVEGFRIDVASLLAVPTDFSDLNGRSFIKCNANDPHLHGYLHEMNSDVFSLYDITTVGEAVGVKACQAIDYVGESRKEIDMIFHFDIDSLDRNRNSFNYYDELDWTLSQLKEIIEKWDSSLKKKGWNSVYLGNMISPGWFQGMEMIKNTG